MKLTAATEVVVVVVAVKLMFMIVAVGNNYCYVSARSIHINLILAQYVWSCRRKGLFNMHTYLVTRSKLNTNNKY